MRRAPSKSCHGLKSLLRVLSTRSSVCKEITFGQESAFVLFKTRGEDNSYPQNLETHVNRECIQRRHIMSCLIMPVMEFGHFVCSQWVFSVQDEVNDIISRVSSSQYHSKPFGYFLCLLSNEQHKILYYLTPYFHDYSVLVPKLHRKDFVTISKQTRN